MSFSPLCQHYVFKIYPHGSMCGSGLLPAVLAPWCAAPHSASALSPALCNATKAVVNSPAWNCLYSGQEFLGHKVCRYSTWLNSEDLLSKWQQCSISHQHLMRTPSLLHECLKRTSVLYLRTHFLGGVEWEGLESYMYIRTHTY